MNERIEKLFDQALEEFKAENKYATIVVPDPLQRDFVEKFAELIVQDNIRTLRSNGYDDAAQCLQDIHFGIEDPV